MAEKKKKTAKAKAKKTTRSRSGAKSLVIVESPTKASTLSRYLGKGYAVKATVGHIRDLPRRELGVDVDAGFAPKYVTIRGKAKTLNEIKRAAKTADTIYLATDPDREGEAIAWHVADQIGNGDKVRRVLLREITKNAVHDALAKPGVVDEKKVDAQQARRILDRLVGYKTSPLLWKSIQTGLSAGRVQTVALRLIIEREQAIREFKPQEYWSITADLTFDDKAFQAKLNRVRGHKPQLRSEADTTQVLTDVTGQPFVVSKVTERKRRKNPAAPFTTSTLQQEAAKKLGFSAARTMRVAQSLYEGVDLGPEGAVGLITYMRTDSVRTSEQSIAAARDLIGSQYGAEYVPDTPNTHINRKGKRTQDAHEAIRPTSVERTPNGIKAHLSEEQIKLYRLIWQRFVASQVAPARLRVTSVDFEIGEYLFRASGTVVDFDGYHAVYTEAREQSDGRALEDEQTLPVLKAGDEAVVQAITPRQHFTEPPPRFSEASLVKELEALGIGRPSTYASIISTLRAREYVNVTDRRFFPTELGETVAGVMVRLFPNIFNVEFTSQMEDELDRVEEGDAGWQEVLADFWDPFSKALSAVDEEALIREAHNLGDLADQKCPRCGSGVQARSGRFGPYLACQRYPECKYTKALKRDRPPDRPSDHMCQECGSRMVIKTGRFGEFLACMSYPKCKHTRPVPLGVKCPKCTVGDLTARRTRRGRTFYGCVRYPECDFSTWHRPVTVECPACDNLGVEERSTKARGKFYRCLKCEHEFQPEEPANESDE